MRLRASAGTVVIAESHLSAHTWPEAAYVAVYFFTCGGLDPRPGLGVIGGILEADSYRMQEIVRGLPQDVEPAGALLPSDVQILSSMVPVQPVPGNGRL